MGNDHREEVQQRGPMDPTTGALVVAALAVIVTPFTAWLTFVLGRNQERARWKYEREGEATRWQRQENTRRIQRGEDAAEELLGIVDSATELLRKTEKYDQAQFEPYYRDIRRLALLLTDVDARARMFEVANGLFYLHEAYFAVLEPVPLWEVAVVCASASSDVLGAYLSGRPIPPTPRLAALAARIDQGVERFAHYPPMDSGDPQDEPQLTAAENAESSHSE